MVMTAPGRSKPTLQKCVDSIWQAGFRRFILSEDPGYWPEITTRGEFSRRAASVDKPLGPWPHFLDLLPLSYQLNEAGGGLLIVQDDVILPKGLAAWLTIKPEWRLQRHIASLWLPSFFHVEPPYDDICNTQAKPGDIEWWSLGRHDLPRRAYGALAILMTLSVAGELQEWGRPEQGMSKADYRLGEFCKDTGHTWLYPTRSLVEHAGADNSSLSKVPRQKVYTLANNPVKDCEIEEPEVE